MAFWWPLLVLAFAYAICRFLLMLIPPNVPSIEVDASDGTLFSLFMYTYLACLWLYRCDSDALLWLIQCSHGWPKSDPGEQFHICEFFDSVFFFSSESWFGFSMLEDFSFWILRSLHLKFPLTENEFDCCFCIYLREYWEANWLGFLRLI